MTKYMIRGGRRLFGEVTVSGAKNAAVAIIPAALLVDGVCRIENIPQISDVTLFFSILEELGAKVRVLNRHAIEIDCHAIHSTRPSYDLARRIRASYYLLGALLGGVIGTRAEAPPQQSGDRSRQQQHQQAFPAGRFGPAAAGSGTAVRAVRTPAIRRGRQIIGIVLCVHRSFSVYIMYVYCVEKI